jgi:hypothetical protein
VKVASIIASPIELWLHSKDLSVTPVLNGVQSWTALTKLVDLLFDWIDVPAVHHQWFIWFTFDEANRKLGKR